MIYFVFIAFPTSRWERVATEAQLRHNTRVKNAMWLSQTDRLCEEPLKCHREDPRRVESSTDEVGRRSNLKNSKERARLLHPDKKHGDYLVMTIFSFSHSLRSWERDEHLSFMKCRAKKGIFDYTFVCFVILVARTETSALIRSGARV